MRVTIITETYRHYRQMPNPKATTVKLPWVGSGTGSLTHAQLRHEQDARTRLNVNEPRHSDVWNSTYSSRHSQMNVSELHFSSYKEEVPYPIAACKPETTYVDSQVFNHNDTSGRFRCNYINNYAVYYS